MPKGFIEINIADKDIERVILAIKSIESICAYKDRTRIVVGDDAYYEVSETVEEVLNKIKESQDA